MHDHPDSLWTTHGCVRNPLQEACYNQSLPMLKRAVRVSPGLYCSVIVPRNHTNRLSRTWRMQKISKELKEH